MCPIPIHTPKAPATIGPYSQAMKSGNLLFISGQLPINTIKGELITEIKEATHTCLKNIRSIAEEAGTSLEHAIKLTIFMKNIGDFDKVNSIYAEYFTEPYPARAVVEVSKLPKNACMEIEAILELN